MWGIDGVRVFTRIDRRLDRRRRALEGRVRKPGMSASAGDRLRRPAGRSPWGICRAVWLDRTIAARNRPSGSITPQICRTLASPKIKFCGMAVLRFVARAPDERRPERFNSHAEGTDHPMVASTARGAAGRRPRLRRTLNAQWIVEKNGYLSPAPRQAWHAVDLNQARRVRRCPRNRVRYKVILPAHRPAQGGR